MMKKMLLSLCCATAIVAGAQEKIVIDGSTTVGPIAKVFAEKFMKDNPKVNVTVSESGSGNGAKSLINGVCDIAAMSREMKPKEQVAAREKGIEPVKHVIALDGLSVVVNQKNWVKDLSISQLKDIYLGKITNWKEVGGPNQKIVVISRDTNSGTYETFSEKVLNKEKVIADAEVVGANGAVVRRIVKTTGAIGYLGIGFVDKSLKALKINKIEATTENVKKGVYPISRELFFYTNKLPDQGSALEKFVNLYQTEEGKEMIEAIGFIATEK